jgi:hypothetical protein
VNIKRLFKRRIAASSDRPTRKFDQVDNKDILAFIIALYQLFAPLLLALLVAGAMVVLIILFLFR